MQWPLIHQGLSLSNTYFSEAFLKFYVIAMQQILGTYVLVILVWKHILMRFDTDFDPIMEFYNRSNEAETVQTQALLAQWV